MKDCRADRSAVLDALGSQACRSILRVVAEGEVGAGVIRDRLPMSGSTVTRHLRVLCEANLLRRQRSGSTVLYGLAYDALLRIRLELHFLTGSACV